MTILIQPDNIECGTPVAEALCHVNASCSDSQGSFQCTCIPPLVGDGAHCYGIDLNIISII